MFDITRDYIKHGNSRSGQQIKKVLFIVAHDTGNPGSTAYNNRNYFNNHQPSASAHTFIDDKYILEIVPLYEKAWHVQYQKPKDNQMFGADSNDAAIGVELCWGGKINFNEAYKRYVWYHAYLCKTFKLNPRKHIVAHSTLDPGRKTDPENALNRYGITWSKFINDVVREYEGKPEPQKEEPFMLEQAIVFNSSADFASVESLINRTGAPAYTRTKAEQLGEVAKEIIIVGGGKGKLKAKKFTDLSGKNRFETSAKVATYLK